MKPGRRPAPTHLKLLRGNPGDHKDRLNLNEPQPEQVANVPDPPPYLVGHAADEWCVVAEELQRLDLLAIVDLPSLGAYCYAYGQWRTAAEALARMAANDPVMSGLVIKGRYGDAIQNPLVSIARKAAGDMVRYAAEFGLTPSARTRIDAGPGGGNGPGKFDGFLAG
jgi:P27 family predicted phage terminase small subunit